MEFPINYVVSPDITVNDSSASANYFYDKGFNVYIPAYVANISIGAIIDEHTVDCSDLCVIDYDRFVIRIDESAIIRRLRALGFSSEDINESSPSIELTLKSSYVNPSGETVEKTAVIDVGK